jgi:hypothetical protein
MAETGPRWLVVLPTMQGDPNVSKSWEQFVKGWDGTASGYKFEPFRFHWNKSGIFNAF